MQKPLAHLLYRLKYRYAPELRLTRPVDVSLELASVCNQRCGYCYHAAQDKLPFAKGLMDLKTAYLIITDAAQLGTNSIKFNYRGEPTMNPFFKEIAVFAKEHANKSAFIDRVVNSNFKFKSDRSDIFDGLFQMTKVKVSFDSFIPEVMESQRAGSIHSLAMNNIDIFYHDPRRKNVEIVIQAVRTQLNKEEDIEQQVKLRWPEAKVSIRDMVTGRVEKDLSGLENKSRNFEDRQSCIQAHARLIFDYKGTAQACCPDIKSQISLGNIHDKNIMSIWNSNEATALRNSLRNKSAFNSDPCKSCASFESFRGYRPPWGS